MEFTRRIWQVMENFYADDPETFWLMGFALTISIGGIYLTLPLYRRYIGTEKYSEASVYAIFLSVGVILVLPLLGVELLLYLLQIKVEAQNWWYPTPLIILTTYTIKRSMYRYFSMRDEQQKHTMHENKEIDGERERKTYTLG